MYSYNDDARIRLHIIMNLYVMQSPMLFTHLYICVCMCIIYIYIYIYVYIHIYIYIYIYICTCVYIHIYVYIYMYTHIYESVCHAVPYALFFWQNQTNRKENGLLKVMCDAQSSYVQYVEN